MRRFEDKSLSPRERAEDLLSRLSLREKAGQINQRLYGFRCFERLGDDFRLTEEFQKEVRRYHGLGVLYGLYRADPWSARTEENGIPPRLTKKAYNQVQRYVISNSPFGIPALMSSECPHGHQALGGWLLPVNLNMGATFHPELVKAAFFACARQMAETGVDLALISMLDVLRDPRWGRSEECYGEDPYLCACLAAAATEGCKMGGVDVVAKHLCAQGEGTGGINASAARLGMRELREIHLPPVLAAVQAGAAGVMAAYNEIDGLPCHANKALLQTLLREEMGFEGIVMADGLAVDRLTLLTKDTLRAGALAINSGVDVSLWDEGFSRLEEAVAAGLTSNERLDEAALRVLTLKFARGLFEKPYLEEEKPLQFTGAHPVESLGLARQSIVLLKNENNILPLKGGRVCLIGPHADTLYPLLGDYTPPMTGEKEKTLKACLQELSGGAYEILYYKGCGVLLGEQWDLAEAIACARTCDVIVLAIGGSSSRFAGARFDENGAAKMDGAVEMECGEGMDIATIELPAVQKELARQLIALHIPVVTVIFSGRPYAVTDIAAGSAALLWAFYPGPYGGQAAAEILLGLHSPCGRLPVTIPRHAGQIPCAYNAKDSYAHFAYQDLPPSPLYAFGQGMSYTRFQYADFRMEKQDGALTVSFRMINAGDMAAYGTPMIFLHWLSGSVIHRRKELKAFQKVHLLPGGDKTVRIPLPRESFFCWDQDLLWREEKGQVEILVEEGGEALWRIRLDMEKGYEVFAYSG